MLESSSFFRWLSVALLFAAGAAWLKLGRGPLMRKVDGRSSADTQQIENASRLLAVAVGFSAVAAILAIAGSVFG